nr:MAG TPA: hypothetical protein [Caudoviricetes sp.]
MLVPIYSASSTCFFPLNASTALTLSDTDTISSPFSHYSTSFQKTCQPLL